MSSEMPSRWESDAKKEILDCPIFRVFEKQYFHPVDHRCGKFYVLESTDWVQVIALSSQRKLLMVEQFRFGAEILSLETPGGLIDPGENPIAAAVRELFEETGYCGENARCIASIYPNPAFMSNQLHIVTVENCKKISAQHLDANEEIRCVELTLPECLRKIMTGEIRHGIAIATLLTYQLHQNH
jgi:8-oxo-dGTP pyrophosphatase MutT (NUDIX family)